MGERFRHHLLHVSKLSASLDEECIIPDTACILHAIWEIQLPIINHPGSGSLRSTVNKNKGKKDTIMKFTPIFATLCTTALIASPVLALEGDVAGSVSSLDQSDSDNSGSMGARYRFD